ncbi:cytochrome c family protein [uncultured Maritalea sp.]|jgi:cytochrome c|uniref:c-type cytochrome n=1 Tax=uncultured Maritalea sp. TaxID=757249 RepID=UPI0026280BC1|nr:cytochrome c family protein [uncultured Maritalea sp.]
MNWIDLQKIFGAVLGTLLFIMAGGFLAETVYHPVAGSGGGYTLEAADAGHSDGDGAETVVEEVSLAALLANADAASGEKLIKKCTACHSFDEGGANKVGPALYGVVDRPIAGVDGFGYSDVFNGYKAEGKVWSYDDLNAFLTKPKDYAPGTKMSFAGLKKETDRADLLAYLQTLSASPVAFPTE